MTRDDVRLDPKPQHTQTLFERMLPHGNIPFEILISAPDIVNQNIQPTLLAFNPRHQRFDLRRNGMIERKQTGVYNCNGVPGAITMGGLLDECKVVSGSDASFTWVDEDFLLQEQVGPWSELPLWLPDVPTLKGFMYVNSDRAIEAGLTFRPLTQTIADTLSWYQTTSTNEAMKAGLSAEKEQDLLNRCEHSKEK